MKIKRRHYEAMQTELTELRCMAHSVVRVRYNGLGLLQSSFANVFYSAQLNGDNTARLLRDIAIGSVSDRIEVDILTMGVE